jgi:hypothetical protein
MHFSDAVWGEPEMVLHAAEAFLVDAGQTENFIPFAQVLQQK